MRTTNLRIIVAATMVCAALAGCRRDPYLDGFLEMERANRMDLEDRVYELEDELATTREALARAQGGAPAAPSNRTRGATPLLRSRGTMKDEDLTPPMIEPGESIEPKIEIPGNPTPPPNRGAQRGTQTRSVLRRPVATATPAAFVSAPEADDNDDPNPPVLPEAKEIAPTPHANAQQPTPAFRAPATPTENEDESVASLFINPFLTTGIDLDQQPGDDALRVVFEPRGPSGRFVPKSGRVSMVLIDPTKEGDDARVARWELSQRDIGEGILEARPERGVRLELPWPQARPHSSKLTLFIRYEDSAGEQIEASSDVAITIPGQVSQRWTPRSQPEGQ